MKIKFSLDNFFTLVENKILDKIQGEIIFNNLMTNQNNPLPYITKKQLKIFRQMDMIKI